MPRYQRICARPPTPACLNHSFEVVCHWKQVQGVKCTKCGGPTDPDPAQYGSISVQREWLRGHQGRERRSMELAFQERGIPEIKADCPSMDFHVENGRAVPVYHNDAHQRRCLKEMGAVKKRCDEEREHKKQEARSSITAAEKSRVVKELLGKVERGERSLPAKRRTSTAPRAPGHRRPAPAG